LKKPLPDVIYKLGAKELIIFDKKERGRADFRICLNIENIFVKKEIYRVI
jgi:hypothetical protein